MAIQPPIEMPEEVAPRRPPDASFRSGRSRTIGSPDAFVRWWIRGGRLDLATPLLWSGPPPPSLTLRFGGVSIQQRLNELAETQSIDAEVC